MNGSSRFLRVRLLVPALALLAGSLALPAAAVAANPLSGNCNVVQINNNSWVTSTADSTQAQGWITTVSARISVYNYALCNAFIIAPNVSASMAWVAIEGMPTSGNNIVQVGYIKCQIVCVNGFDYQVLDYFWAAGQDGDIFHLPFPVKIGVADASQSHTFVTQLRMVNGAYQWQFLIDGVIRATTNDSWRTWNRNRIEIGNEVWNCGDQLGGRTASGTDPGNQQKFDQVAWTNASSHTGGLGPSEPAGNSYPWSDSHDYSSAKFHVWTSAHTAGDCSG